MTKIAIKNFTRWCSYTKKPQIG